MMVVLWRQLGDLVPPAVPERRLNQLIPLVVNLSLFLAMWALGSALGAGRRRSAELLDRTVALERQREANARRAVFDERVRIARELHDVVAHHVSVMGVQAGAARRVMQRQPDQAAEALSSIEASSRQAVTELDRLLGFLRRAGDDDGLAPQPALAQLDVLIAQAAQGELHVDLEIEGDVRPLSETLEVSAYRIIQEALTNTRKHSPGASATVRVSYLPTALEVVVLDDGAGSISRGDEKTGGNGLIGMRERTSLHGGHLRVGPRSEGGFAVHATFPLDRAS
jgi:signal transduction histidine kinase